MSSSAGAGGLWPFWVLDRLCRSVGEAGWVLWLMEGGEERRGGTPSIQPAQKFQFNFMTWQQLSCHYVRAESQRVAALSPLWWLCFPCSVCQRSRLHWSPPGVCQRTAPPRWDMLTETRDQRRSGWWLRLLAPSPFPALAPSLCRAPSLSLSPYPSPSLALFLCLLLHSCPQGC